MKPGIPWSLRGVDEETREAIYEAARRAGLSVSEWLNSNVGDRDAVQGTPEQKSLPAIATALDRLTDRLRSMDERALAAVPGLARRLDEIERHLDDLSAGDPGIGGKAALLKRIAAMIDKLARDIEDADERARTMIEGLRANRPAVSTSDIGRVTEAINDLDRRIARMGERPPVQEPAPRLDDIRHRLNALLAEGPKAPPAETNAGSATIDAALRALESRIDEAKARLIAPHAGDRRSGATTREGEQIARIERRLSDIGRQLASHGQDPGAPGPADTARSGRADDLATAIAEISAHQRALDEHAETLGLRRSQEALSATMAALRTDIAALADQVAALTRSGAQDQGATFDLARRIEALSTERPLDRSLLSAIRTDLESLRGAVAGQLDELKNQTPDRTRLDALGEEVSALRRALEADDSPRAIQRLEMRVAELGRSLEAALSGRNATSATADIDRAIQRLEQRLEAMSHELAERLAERAAPVASAEIDRLEKRLDTLSRSIIATLSERNQPVAPTVAQRLEERLDEIAARVDDLLDRAPAVASIATMQARLQSLIESVEGLSASQREPAAALDEIKSEIAAIRREIGERGPPDTAHLERQIRELAERLETATRPESEAGALAELESQVARLASQFEHDQPRSAALHHVEEGLERLQALLSEGHRESIEAARAEARAAVQELSETAGQRAAVDSELIQALRRDLDSLRAAAAHPSAQTAPASVDRTLSQVVERLGRLEQEAGGAQRATGTHGPEVMPVAGETMSAAVIQQAKPGSDRRADFIAAARRAAQAAAAEAARVETVPAEEPAASGEPKPGAFARISQAIRNRRRPLLLAAAAIVLAIGAMQVYGTFGERDGSTGLITPEDTAATPAATAATTALVPPSAKPDAQIAFAAPEAFDSRFGSPPGSPAAGSFDKAALPSATAASQPAAMAVALPAPAPTNAGAGGAAPDAAIGPEKLVTAAASGDPAAAFEVAARYAEGGRVAKDLAKAAEWYERAAEGGVAVAQYRLGSLYERGQGVAKNLDKAVTWYQRAADQGNVNAMHNLAVLMSEGVDGTPDQDKALQWFLAAADYGVRDSQYNLGVIFARGLGPKQDLVASYKWFAVAAAQGDTDAAARRDEVAKLLPGDDLAKARAAVQAWHVKPPLAEANSVSTPDGGWDGPGNTLGEADRQALVKTIQTLLAEQGFDPGPADGVIGERTRQAVRAYQRQNGIAETGRIDRALVAALADQRV